MEQRDLGKTGMRVSEIGMGCNRLGESYEPTEYWVDLVSRAVDLGVTIFDTAEAYGWGASEEVLGLAIGNHRDVFIATKMCRVRETNEKQYTAARMMETCEGSLGRLKRERIDVYQLHSPNRAELERYDWADGFRRLKEQGKIRAGAVAVNNAGDGLWCIENGNVDVLQITYNIFQREAEEALFAAAADAGVGLLCRMPLARGVLTGKFTPGQSVPDGHRALLDGGIIEERIEMAESLKTVADGYPGGLTALAHHFCLSPPEISAIIPGARNTSQLEANVAASNGKGLPTGYRKKINERIAG
jgi:aryl-alcohol dehydrogenase-like predicted oxidoreductase